MKGNKHDATPKMKTLLESVNEAQSEGYNENFKVTERGLTAGDSQNIYTPEHISIKDFYRFEGYSDPQDNSILYLIATDDGKQGILIDAYGADADAKISEFIRKVEDIQKKEN